jgi:hypothetical protein
MADMQYTPSGSEQARTLETFRPFDNPEICSPPPAPQPELPCLPDWNTEEFFLAHGSGATRDGEVYDLPNNFSSSKVALSFEPDRRAVGTRNPVGEGGARGRSSTSSFLQGSPSSAGFKTKTVGLRDVQPQSAVVPPGSQTSSLKDLVDDLPPFPFSHTPTVDPRREATRSVTYEDLVTRGKAGQGPLRERKVRVAIVRNVGLGGSSCSLAELEPLLALFRNLSWFRRRARRG